MILKLVVPGVMVYAPVGETFKTLLQYIKVQQIFFQNFECVFI